MRGRVGLWISLGLNVALAALVTHFLTVPAPNPIAVRPPSDRASLASNPVRTSVVVRRQNFVWNDIESDDYAVYIANLRLIGCPEATIRDLIVADVNQLFTRRRATEIVTPQQQWWKPEPDPEIARTAADKTRELDAERRNLLNRLLGPEWESADYPYPAPFPGIPLDGPWLGDLSPAVRSRVQEVERAAYERQQSYVEERQREGRPLEPEELVRMRRETRERLAALLKPEQLEEYLLRYSNNAHRLRSELRGLNPTPEEFRALFRSVDAVDEAHEALAGDRSTEAARRRAELERQRESALKQALGPERYEQYTLNQDPLYQTARGITDQAGASADQVVRVAAVVRLTQEEEERIRRDDTLTADQKADRLEVTRQAQQDSLRRLLGDTAWQRYLENSRRLWENPP